jgi:hypothetical protein
LLLGLDRAIARTDRNTEMRNPVRLVTSINENDVMTQSAQSLFQLFLTAGPPTSPSADYNQGAPAQKTLQTKVPVMTETSPDSHVHLSGTGLKHS